jgi:hypothetical protein
VVPEPSGALPPALETPAEPLPPLVSPPACAAAVLLPRVSAAALRAVSPSLAAQLHFALATKLAIPPTPAAALAAPAATTVGEPNKETATTVEAAAEVAAEVAVAAQAAVAEASATAAAAAATAATVAYVELFARLQADLALKLVGFGPCELVDTATSLAALADRWPALALPHADALLDRIARRLTPPFPPGTATALLAAHSTGSTGSSSSSSVGGTVGAGGEGGDDTGVGVWPPARFSSLQLARLASALATWAGGASMGPPGCGSGAGSSHSGGAIPTSTAAGEPRRWWAHGVALSEARTLAVAALHADAGRRLNELSSTRADVFYAGSCQQWCRVYFAAWEAALADEALNTDTTGQ